MARSFWFHGILAALVGVALAYFSVVTQTAKPLIDIWGAALYWPEKPALEARTLFQVTTSWLAERKGLRERLADVEGENLALRKKLDELAHPVPPRYGAMLPAKVTLRYPEAWWGDIRLDKGRRDGVKLGYPALSGGYLIGKVVRLEDSYSWVELLTSSSLLMAVVVEETRDIGVIRGDDKGNVVLDYIPDDKPISRDMKLSTAMVGEFIPPGIPIGSILSPLFSIDGFTPYKVVLGAHLTQLYTVEILTSTGAYSD